MKKRIILTEENKETIFLGVPKIYGSNQDIVYRKIKSDILNWTWYVLEANIDRDLLYCFVDGHYPESGYVSLEELYEIEAYIDTSFKITNLDEILKTINK